jgi:hypothetical protein
MAAALEWVAGAAWEWLAVSALESARLLSF